jgi:hypothetical protein
MQLDSLAQRIQELSAKKTHVNGEFQRWVSDVDRLFKSAEEWLSAEIAAGQIGVHEQAEQVAEPTGDRYEFKKLAIQLNNDPLLLLVPRGMHAPGIILKYNDRIMGASGRVDMVNFANRRWIGLYRAADGIWLMPGSDGQSAWVPLDKDQFRSAMARLLG